MLHLSYNADDQILGEMYDANGNTMETGGKTFRYDSRNELVSMNGGAVTLVYDGDGNRVGKTASGVTTRYLVDDLNPTGYAQVVEETGGTQREYTYGLQRIDEGQTVSNAWALSYYGYDGLGTVRQLTNSAGMVTDTYDYDAFGNQISHTGSTPNNYLYRGEQFDPDLGLYYLRARYYNPLTGRFMSRDPEDGDLTNPKTLHKYLYAEGDPINLLDPRGRESMLETGSLDALINEPALPALREFGGTGARLLCTAIIFAAKFIPSYSGPCAIYAQFVKLLEYL
jgi:RHS repeat-associated protein